MLFYVDVHPSVFRSISQVDEKTIIVVYLLGSVTLASAAENGTSDSGVIIDAKKKLVSITEPSIDLDLSGLGLQSLVPSPIALPRGLSICQSTR